MGLRPFGYTGNLLGGLVDRGQLGILPAATAVLRALTHATGSVLGSGRVRPGGGKPADHAVRVQKKKLKNFKGAYSKLAYRENQLARRLELRGHHA